MFLGSFVIAVVCGRFALVELTVMRVYIIKLEAEGVQLAVCARCALLHCEGKGEGDGSYAYHTVSHLCCHKRRERQMLGTISGNAPFFKLASRFAVADAVTCR